MILLHPNLAPLTRLAEKPGSGRWAMSGIHLVQKPDGYRVEVTNGKALAVVDGDNAGDPEEFPDVPALTAAPNGAAEALILASEFAKIMKDVPKKCTKAVLNTVAVVIGEKVTTLATTDLDSNLVRQPRNMEGRFPATDQVIPTDKTEATVKVDANLFAELLEIAAGFAAEGSAAEVEIGLRGNRPITVTTSNQGQKFTGVLMPLFSEQPKKSRIDDEEPARKKLVLPTIHPNGTSKTELVDTLCSASAALDAAYGALKRTAPNARDYYPQGDSAIVEVTAQHMDRLRRLDAIKDEIDELTRAF